MAEAWDSGAREWDPKRREAYANDLGDSTSLIAVTTRSNCSKSEQDPAEWMPPSGSAACRYTCEWTSVKTRWGLAVDQAELEVLDAIVAD
ncbi:HNH endonuclease family protein [Glycomyces harbinensis]|uniref:HNH endonuclease family protein n=1 Tax=Glycomyces harbinensis TaxID=58114 RepID=UPI001C40AEA2|nr:HNH endonuclease family protein [Glycomyces harbinensis]